MRREVPLGMAIVVILVVIVIAGGIVWWLLTRQPTPEGAAPKEFIPNRLTRKEHPHQPNPSSLSKGFSEKSERESKFAPALTKMGRGFLIYMT
jgi:cytoskeletal protein RodZ